MATKYYLDKAGMQHFWTKICWQDQDLLSKITANANRIAEIAQQQGKIWVENATTAAWDSEPTLVAEQGIIYVYTDARTVLNQTAPRVKIGDGETLLKDLQFIDEDINTAIKNLETRIDDKVGCRMDETTLQFYKD